MKEQTKRVSCTERLQPRVMLCRTDQLERTDL